MQTNDQTPSADESGNAKTTETGAKPGGLIETLLGAVLEGKDAVDVPANADSSTQDQEEKGS